MKIFFITVLMLSSFFAASVSHAEISPVFLRMKIKSAQHMGAHGFGYNTESLNQLSNIMKPEDAQYVLPLLADKEMATGASFALAAMCQDGLGPLKKAVDSNILPDYMARDSLDLMISFDKCDKTTKDGAAVLLTEIDRLAAERAREIQAKNEKDAADIQRNNINGLKMLDPAASKTLTQEERAEVFNNSVKALGLDGARTPEQEDLYQKMRKTMLKEE